MRINQEAILTLKDQQAFGISAKTLSTEQLALAIQSKWFKIWVPKNLEGLGLDLATGVRFLEELSYYDGGLAWTVTLCSGANLFVGFIEQDLAKEIFYPAAVCFGGSGRATGFAEKNEKGYIINGQWKYATGAPHLTHFTANCVITENNIPLLDAQGNTVIKSFFFDRDDVLIHYDWDTFGLECTASHSFSVEHLQVHASRSFVIDEQSAHLQNKLYQYPFKPFAEFTLLANFMGMYKRFMDLVEKYLIQKSHDPEWFLLKGKKLFIQIDLLQQQFLAARESIYILLDRSWTNMDDAISNEELYLEIAKESRNLVSDIRKNVIELFPICGIAAAQREHELNIVFRNIFTATQHSLLQRED